MRSQKRAFCSIVVCCQPLVLLMPTSSTSHTDLYSIHIAAHGKLLCSSYCCPVCVRYLFGTCPLFYRTYTGHIPDMYRTCVGDITLPYACSIGGLYLIKISKTAYIYSIKFRFGRALQHIRSCALIYWGGRPNICGQSCWNEIDVSICPN